MKKIIIILLVVLFSFQTNAALKIDITGGHNEPMPIAIAEFTGIKESEDVRKIIVDNLENSGLFRIINKDAYIQKIQNVQETPRFLDWQALNAQALLFANLEQMEDGRYALIEIKTGVNKVPEAEKSLLKFRDVIRKHNEEVLKNPEHPRAIYREPSALIVICATAPFGYTTDSGVKVVPVGCLKD